MSIDASEVNTRIRHRSPQDRIQGGSLPFIYVVGDTVPEVWHNLCLRCWNEGIRERTPKHQEEFPLGFEANVAYKIGFPLAEPRLHSSGCCDEPLGLVNYTLELVYGTHDHWVKPDTEKKPEEKGQLWHYTYHHRLTRICRGSMLTEVAPNVWEMVPFEAPQDELLENKITDDWEKRQRFGRDYLLLTGIPEIDNLSDDSPCLQMIQFRLLQDYTQTDTWKLVWNFVFRSHDLFNGWPMNMFALSEYQRWWALRLSRVLGLNIEPGEMNGLSTSLHHYGSYFVKTGLAERLQIFSSKPWTDFAWPTEKFNMTPADVRRYYRIIAAQLDFERKTGQQKANPEHLAREGYDLDTYPYPSDWNQLIWPKEFSE